MAKSVTEHDNLEALAQKMIDDKRQLTLLYAFNGTGKTRLSMEFKKLLNRSTEIDTEEENNKKCILYYNAFTEDLFSWDNDLENDSVRTFRMNMDSSFFQLIVSEGIENAISDNFQKYTKSKITPVINMETGEVTFELSTGDENHQFIKISKGEESIFIWSVFLSLIQLAIVTVNDVEGDRTTSTFDTLQYIYLDDPITSLDDNYIFEVAYDIKHLVRDGRKNLKFVISTHHSLLYTILFEEFNRLFDKNDKEKRKKRAFYVLEHAQGKYYLKKNSNSPFGYHLYVKNKIDTAIQNDAVEKYHFALFRNLLEKTATFLGYSHWKYCLVGSIVTDDNRDLYVTTINNYSHNRHATLDESELHIGQKNLLITLFRDFEEAFKWSLSTKGVDEN